MEVSSLNSLSVQPEPSSLTSTLTPAAPGSITPTSKESPAAVAEAPQPDSVTLSPITVETSQGILNQQIRIALTQTFQMNMTMTGTGYPTDLAPAPLAGQILSAVRGALSLSSAPPDAENPAATPVDLAKASVDQGVQETRNVLSNLGVSGGPPIDSVDQTQGLIHQGLNAMEVTTPPPAPTMAPPSSMTYTSIFARAQSTSLQIQTADGDTVSLEISSQQGRLNSLTLSGDGSAVTASSSNVSLNSQSLDLTVEGSLDKQELKAIRKLIHKVSEIAEKFFKGDIFESLKKISSLKIDSEQLSGFSLDLSYEAIREVSLSHQTAPASGDALPTDTATTPGPALPASTSGEPVATTGTPASTSPVAPASTEPVAGSVPPTPTDSSTTTGSPTPANPADVQSGMTPPAGGVSTSPTQVSDLSASLSILIQQFQQFVTDLQASGLFQNPMKAMDDMVDAVGQHRHPEDHEAQDQMKMGFKLLKALTHDLRMSS